MNFLIVCLTVLVGLAPLGARAATDGGAFAVRGAGIVDCKTFLTERKKRSRAYLMMGGWIDGYLTGINQSSPDTYDATSFESTELFAQIIADHCKTHPDDRLYAVMRSIVAQRWKGRMTKRSPFVNVTLGKQSTRLYRETVKRMQQRLADKGLLKAQPNGKFDAKTISAIAAFQKTLAGYKATGFPDQATLYMLFAGAK